MKSTLLLIFFLIISVFSFAQYTSIPDANFEIALGEFDDIPNDGQVPTANINTITTLYIEHRNISDLTGIQDFIAVQYLNCSHNQLTSLDFSQNSNLVSLSCSINQLASLDVSQNSNLEILYCSVNQLTSLDISQNPNLEFLSCSGNQLTNLNVSQNPNLEILYCVRNQLTNLDVSQISNLAVLECYDNQLTNLDVSQISNLGVLYCARNQLTSLDVSQNPNLGILYCENNQLRNLNINNGNNHNLVRMSALGNLYLTCIQVDDETANIPDCVPIIEFLIPGWCVEDGVLFSENCTLGTEDNNSISFSVYPNPVQNILNIQSKEHIQSIKIYSLYGNLLKEVALASIDITDLSTGIYFAQVSINNKMTTKKFIKL